MPLPSSCATCRVHGSDASDATLEFQSLSQWSRRSRAIRVSRSPYRALGARSISDTPDDRQRRDIARTCRDTVVVEPSKSLRHDQLSCQSPKPRNRSPGVPVPAIGPEASSRTSSSATSSCAPCAGGGCSAEPCGGRAGVPSRHSFRACSMSPRVRTRPRPAGQGHSVSSPRVRWNRSVDHTSIPSCVRKDLAPPYTSTRRTSPGSSATARNPGSIPV